MGKFLLKLNERTARFDIFELGNSVIIYYFAIFYLVPIFAYFDILENISRQDFFFKGFLNVTIGLFFLIFGYIAGNFLPFKTPKFLKREWDFKRAWWVFWIIFGFSLTIKLIRVVGGGYSHLAQNPLFLKSQYYSLMGNFDWVAYISLVIAFAIYFHLKKNSDDGYKKWRVAAWLTFSLEFIYAIPTCTRMLAIIPIVLYLIVRWYVYERNYLKVAGILIFSILILFPFGTICRIPAYTNLSRTQFLKIAIDNKQDIPQNNSASQSILNIAANSGDYAISSFLWRINQSTIINGIIKNPQPFYYGKTFKELLFTFGPPRFLWENKPASMNANGNNFGHEIGVLSDFDFKTSVGATLIGDWYLNFGLFGIIMGMFLMGVIFRAIYNYFIKNTELSLSGVMFYAVIWVQIIKGMEDWIAPVYVGILRSIIILLFIHFLLVKNKTRLLK